MSFLKKLGMILAKGLSVLGVIFPALAPLFGSGSTSKIVTTAVNDFTSIGTVIIQIETALQGATGIDKLKAAVPLVTNIIRTSELVSGHGVANEAEFIAGCTDATNAVVRILNSLKSDHLPNPNGTPVTPAPAATPTPAAPVSA